MDITLALRRAVRGYVHGTEALAAELRMSVTSLNHKVSPTYEGAHCSPEETVEIMEITGDHGALQAQAARLGYVVLPMPRVGDASGDTTAALVSAVREFGELMTTAADTLADGSISDNELRRLQVVGA